jgi:hypothetical protein
VFGDFATARGWPDVTTTVENSLDFRDGTGKFCVIESNSEMVEF